MRDLRRGTGGEGGGGRGQEGAVEGGQIAELMVGFGGGEDSCGLKGYDGGGI